MSDVKNEKMIDWSFVDHASQKHFLWWSETVFPIMVTWWCFGLSMYDKK